MPNTEISTLVRTKSDIECVLIASAVLEDALRTHWNATGTGLGQLASSVEDRLPVGMAARLRKLAGIRNDAAHDPLRFVLRDRARFVRDGDALLAAVRPTAKSSTFGFGLVRKPFCWKQLVPTLVYSGLLGSVVMGMIATGAGSALFALVRAVPSLLIFLVLARLRVVSRKLALAVCLVAVLLPYLDPVRHPGGSLVWGLLLSYVMGWALAAFRDGDRPGQAIGRSDPV
ncbi:hypothetical protein [Thiomonas sp.]